MSKYADIGLEFLNEASMEEVADEEDLDIAELEREYFQEFF